MGGLKGLGEGQRKRKGKRSQPVLGGSEYRRATQKTRTRSEGRRTLAIDSAAGAYGKKGRKDEEEEEKKKAQSWQASGKSEIVQTNRNSSENGACLGVNSPVLAQVAHNFGKETWKR